MHRPRALLLPVVGAILLACSDATAPLPVDPALVGHWATERQNLSPSGWHQYYLTLGARGSFTMEYRSFGLGGRGIDELATSQRGRGAFRTDGDRLILQPFGRKAWWDRFPFGLDSPPWLGRPTTGDAWNGDVRYEVEGDRLTLHYFTYPADGPVPTSRVYFRQD